jgi:hypothetical protein
LRASFVSADIQNTLKKAENPKNRCWLQELGFIELEKLNFLERS